MEVTMKDGATLQVAEIPRYLQRKGKKYEAFVMGDTFYVNRLYYDILYIEAYGMEAWFEFAKKRAMETVMNYIQAKYESAVPFKLTKV